ncbi:MAG: serine hydrolase domain-containing protein, partial [Gemmatimonadales bacterium]
QDAVDSNRIGGAVAIVMRDGKVVYQRAVGWNDREAGRQMAPDALFRIASQTKALTSVAIMMLVEEGRITLGDRVSRFIPAYATTTVASASDTGTVITAARRAITIRDLLTHTAGISYGTDASVAPLYKAKGLGPAAGRGWYTADKDEPICTTMERLASLPFVAQPGEEFVYGYNTDILGCVVERVSGIPLDQFIRTRITVPLGMTHTSFFVPTTARARLTAVYGTDSTGHAERADDGARGQGHYVDGPRRSFSGGAGLVSTAQDYARFLSMLLNGGTIDGVRLLGRRTVEVMTVNQTGTLYSSDGLGFGLGFETVDRFGASGFASQGTYGWGGAYGSNYKVDPAERLVIVYMTQMMPDASGTREKFVNAVYATLVD